MTTFKDKIIENTVNRLIKGEDYRQEIVNAINIEFFDFVLDFFKKIIETKINDKDLDLKWYKDNFINAENLSIEESSINSGINKKTITNIYSSATKEVVLDVANSNF
jgi:hypothetical protein